MNEIASPLAAKKGRTGRTWRCPDESRLAAYTDGKLEARDRAAFEAHLENCDWCLDQVAFLAASDEMGETEPVPPALMARARAFGAPAARTPRLAQIWRWSAALAATACFVVVSVIWLRQPPAVLDGSQPPAVVQPQSASPGTGTATGPSAAPAVAPSSGATSPAGASRPVEPPRSVRNAPGVSALPEILFPQENAAVEREQLELRWRPSPGSLMYVVRIVNEEGGLVWEGRANLTHLRLPASVALAAGPTYYAWVRAVLPDGKHLQSRVVGFRVR